MSAKSQQTRSRLVQAAIEILMEEDEVLSLDAVARRVGISKGGLMHHFHTRDALVEAVVEQLVEDLTSQPGTPGVDATPSLQVYVKRTLRPDTRAATARIARGLIRLYGSDARHDAPFLAPWRSQFASRLDRYRKARDLEGFARTASVVLAVECFVLVDALELYEFSDREVEAIRNELLSRPIA